MQTSIVIKVWNMSLQPSCDISLAHAMCDVGPHETGGDVTSECHTSCHITANMSRRLPWHMTTRLRLREPQNIAFYGPRHIEITPENVYLYSIFWMWGLRCHPWQGQSWRRLKVIKHGNIEMNSQPENLCWIRPRERSDFSALEAGSQQ